MQEFSSVIASSYDAESLAPMLSEKAAEGWTVVSIVSAGTNVVAYLVRGDADGAPSAAVAAPAVDSGVPDMPADIPADDAPATFGGDEPTAPVQDDVPDSTVDVPDSTVEMAPADDAEAAITAAADQFSEGLSAVARGEGVDLGGATSSGDDTASDADESPTVDTNPDQPMDDATTAVDDTAVDAASDGADTTDGVAEHAGAAASPTGDDTAGDEATDGAQDGSGVPAGWYADPSGRYELRYWDGAAWTEHVSRAGQQYTDPPVA